MSIQSFVPTWWEAKLLPILQNSHVYKSLTNSDYEGLVKKYGDTVVINQTSTPSISDYDDDTGLTWEKIQSTSQSLLIDQQKSVSFYIDDVDKAQARDGGAILSKAIQDAGYKMADVIDVALAAQYSKAGIKEGSGAGNLGSASTALEITVDGGGSSVTVLDWLGRMERRAAEGNLPSGVPKSLIVTPWLHQKMVQANILNARGINNDGTYKSGEIQHAFGFNISVSNNVNYTSSKYRIMAGNRNCITMADQLTKMVAIEPEDYFRDAIKALYVYGLKTVRSDQLMCSVVTEGAEGQ